jgi:hypothetical protein
MRMARARSPVLRERLPRTILLDGETIEVRVRESSRARVSRLVVGPRRPLEIVVPRRVTNAQIDRILDARHAWIREQTARMRELARSSGLLGLSRQGCVPLAGAPLRVVRRRDGRPSATLRDGLLVVGGPDERAGEAIERWYRREARCRIEEVAAREAERLGLGFGTIAIRDQRTRWGSCSSSGTLSFSWRLVLAPPEVLRYVVVHELCHLREPNHSPAFWALVDAASPERRACARWLRDNAYELHAFVPTG